MFWWGGKRGGLGIKMQASGVFFHRNSRNLYFSELAREKMQEQPVLQRLRLVLVGNADKANQQKAANAGTFCHCDSDNSNKFTYSEEWARLGVKIQRQGVWSRHECCRKRGKCATSGWMKEFFFLPFESSWNDNGLHWRQRQDWALTAVQSSSSSLNAWCFVRPSEVSGQQNRNGWR